jgi:hypothetical protein
VKDVLYLWSFCGRMFGEGRYVEGRFVGRTFCSEGRFVEGRFVVVPYIQQEAKTPSGVFL